MAYQHTIKADMKNLAVMRAAMVNSQVRTDHVTSRALLDAMATTPRELFAPKSKRAYVYSDCETLVMPERTLMRPCTFARLVQSLEIKSADLVLDIACGSGYSTAIFSHMAEMVIALEDEQAHVEKTAGLLAELGLNNTAVVKGNLKDGLPEHGPFDVIFVNGAVEHVPEAWLEHLSDHGRLGVILRQGRHGEARLYVKSSGHAGHRVLFEANTRLLPGFEQTPAFVF